MKHGSKTKNRGGKNKSSRKKTKPKFKIMRTSLPKSTPLMQCLIAGVARTLKHGSKTENRRGEKKGSRKKNKDKFRNNREPTSQHPPTLCDAAISGAAWTLGHGSKTENRGEVNDIRLSYAMQRYLGSPGTCRLPKDKRRLLLMDSDVPLLA